jgi:hypothetical protein
MYDAERKRILAIRGTMTAVAAGKQFDRDPGTILRAWKSAPGYVEFQQFNATDLSPREASLVSLLREVGEAGMLLSEIVTRLHEAGWIARSKSILSSFNITNSKFVRQGVTERIKRTSKQLAPARYALVVAAVPRLKVSEVNIDWTPSIPAVSRRISGDLGLGATPGAIVSVARVTWLDGRL